MTAIDTEKPTRPESAGMQAWLSPRRKRFWAVVLLLAYTLFGFFAAPPLLRSQVVSSLEQQTGRAAELGEVRINPFLATLEVNDFRLADSDGATLARFDRLFIDFQFSSLFRWAWTFREIRLSGFETLVERFGVGDTRLARLLADIEQRSPPTEPVADAGLPRLLVHLLIVEDGAASIRDHVPADPVELQLGPVTGSVENLSTLPEGDGRQAVRVTLHDGSSLSWQGSLKLGPLHSEGTIEIAGSSLSRSIAYLKAILPLTELEATLAAGTAYRIEERADGEIEFELSGLHAELSDFAVSGLTPEAQFAAFDSLVLTGGRLRYPEQSFSAESLQLSAPRLEVSRAADGQLSLAQLAPAPADAPAADSASPERPWTVELARFEIAEGAVELQDDAVQPSASTALQSLDVVLENLSAAAGQRMPLAVSGTLSSGGDFRFEGKLAALPAIELDGKLSVEGLSLPPFQPYVGTYANVKVGDGALAGAFELAFPADGAATVVGELTINDLAVQDTNRNEPLVGWGRMNLDRFEADLASGSLELSRVELDRPYGRLTIFEDQTTSLAGLLKEEGAESDAAAGKPPAEQPAARLLLGGVVVREGALDFADRSLPLPFATEIRELGGTVSTIDSRSAEPANVRFEGKVDDYGLARIDGGITPLDPLDRTDIRMEFRNLLMSNLSPYSAQFAGQKIAEGKLDLDLRYRITAGALQGGNDIVMRDLVLGDKVDDPDAASLPLGLAVALLKDADGVIDIEVPVEGDVNDPEFRIGGVIWKAFVGLITKVVAAPFRLLGGLIGSDRDDLGAFQFLPGRSDLTPPEREKIGLLQQALDKRPELRVEVAGVYAADVDRPALQFLRLRERVLALLQQRSSLEREDFGMLDDELRGALESIHLERFPETPLEDIRALHRASEEELAAGAPELDELAYAGDLRDRLLAAEEIGPADLTALAVQRAESVLAAMTAAGVAPERLSAGETEEVSSADSEWVAMELGVATD